MSRFLKTLSRMWLEQKKKEKKSTSYDDMDDLYFAFNSIRNRDSRLLKKSELIKRGYYDKTSKKLIFLLMIGAINSFFYIFFSIFNFLLLTVNFTIILLCTVLLIINNHKDRTKTTPLKEKNNKFRTSSELIQDFTLIFIIHGIIFALIYYLLGLNFIIFLIILIFNLFFNYFDSNIN